MKRLDMALVAGCLVLLLALGCRVWQLTASPLWYDETFTLYHAARGPLAAVTGLLREDNTIPLYGLLLSLWVIPAGTSEFAVRFFQVALGVLAVPLVGRWAGAMTGRRLSWGAMLAVATLPIYVYYSQEARMYGLVMALAAAYGWAAWRLLQGRGRMRSYVALGLAMLLAHPYTGFLWATFLVVGTVYTALHRRAGAWLKANGLLALLASPIAGWLLWRAQVDATGPGSPTPLRALAELPVRFGVAQFLPRPWPAVFLGVTLLSLLAGWALLARRRQWTALATLLVGLVLPLVGLLLLGQVKGKWTPYYLLGSWGLALTISAGIGWDLLRGRSRLLGAGLALAWAGLALPAVNVQAGPDWLIRSEDLYPRPDFRSVGQYIAENEAPGDVAVVVAGPAALTLDYYLHDVYHGATPVYGLPEGHVFDIDHPLDLRDLSGLAQATQGAKRLWLVLWRTSLVDPTSVVHSALAENCTRLAVNREFPNVGVLLFDLDGCRPAAAAEPPQPLAVDFGNLRLAGYGFHLSGDTVLLDLWWQATGPVDRAYTAYIHLLSPEGEIVAQDDRLLGADIYPSSKWPVGTLLHMRHTLQARAEPGMRVRVGLYSADGRVRLANGDDGVEIAVPAE